MRLYYWHHLNNRSNIVSCLGNDLLILCQCSSALSLEIDVVFQGSGYVHWTESRAAGDNQRTDSYTGNEQYFHDNFILCGSGLCSHFARINYVIFSGEYSKSGMCNLFHWRATSEF